MTHQMKLNDEPFDMIEQGIKTIELRLLDEKRRLIEVGDEIAFTHSKNCTRVLNSRVIALHIFASFEELYANLPLLKCGYTKENVHTAAPSDMDVYYTRQKQKEYGVVGIEIELI